MPNLNENNSLQSNIMNSRIQIKQPVKNSLAAIALLIMGTSSFADKVAKEVDDFSDPKTNSLGIERQFIDDTSAGGKTTTTHKVSGGILSAAGEIVPPRGQPGWASTVLLLNPEGLAMDASDFEGIRLRIRIKKGNLSVSANSSEVTNFDYHAAMIERKADGEFQEVKVPFTSMKRAWSKQTPLDTKTIASLSLVCFDVQKNTFDFEVDEVSFY